MFCSCPSCYRERQEECNSPRTKEMGSVQLRPDKESVADSIIWLRLQPGVTFVLEDGWLGLTRTLLTLSPCSASRRNWGEGKPFQQQLLLQAEFLIFRGLTYCGSLSVAPPSLFNKCIKLNLVSDIETHTVWKLTYRESFPSAYWVCRGSAEIMASTETDEKCHPSSAVLLIWLPHIPTRSFFCSVSHCKLAARVPTTRFLFFLIVLIDS